MQSNVLAGTVLGVGAAVFVGIFLALLAAGTVAFFAIRNKVRQVSNMMFGTSNVGRIMDEIKQQELEYEATPKSVSGMTRLLEPQIKNSYVDFQWNDFRRHAEKTLTSYLQAGCKGDMYGVENATTRIQEELQKEIQRNADDGVEPHIEDIIFHQTELMNFTQLAGKDMIKAQSAVEYYYYRTQGDKVVEGSKEHKVQTRYSMDFLFVNDANAKEFTDHAITQCPNCGAPVVKVGMICEYCGSAVNPKSEARWLLDYVKQV